MHFKASENTPEELEKLKEDGYYPNFKTDEMERREVCIRISEDIVPPYSKVSFVHNNAPMDASHPYFSADRNAKKYDGKYGIIIYLTHPDMDAIDSGGEEKEWKNAKEQWGGPIIIDIGKAY